MRVLMNKREEFRTEKDEEEDQMLLKRLVDIIEERNEICEHMMKIDIRYFCLDGKRFVDPGFNFFFISFAITPPLARSSVLIR